MINQSALAKFPNLQKGTCIKNKKYNRSGPTVFKSQTVGYQFNQKLLHHYWHSKNQLNKFIFRIWQILGSHELKGHCHF